MSLVPIQKEVRSFITMPSQEIIAPQRPADQDKAKMSQTLDIHFTKSAQFRALHAAGVWFAGDPQQNLHFSFYTERWPLPDKIIVNLNPDGTVINPNVAPNQVVQGGVVREVEVDVALTIQAAVDFYRMLGENLKSINAI